MLAIARIPAIEGLFRAYHTLNDLLDTFESPTCAACGIPNAFGVEAKTIMRACQALVRTCGIILDRTGIGPHSTLEVKQSDGVLDLRLLTDEERATITGQLASLRETKERIKARLNSLAFGMPAPDADDTGATPPDQIM